MIICVHCKREQKHCRCTSLFTTPKTPHNLPGQRYDFWADYGIDLSKKDIWEQISDAMNSVSKAISQALILPREMFGPLIVNWNPVPIDEDVQLPSPHSTTQTVRKMRLPVYYWSCGHCQEEGEQEPYNTDYYPFGMECRHCGQGYTAEQIINDLAYDTDYEWREV